MKKIVFTVTNDLSYDQRMNRICSSLSANNYQVLLVGRKRKHSLPLRKKPYEQHRIPCWFDKGKFFYLEYNIRLFFFLLFAKMDAICAIDLDTILPGLYISKIKKIPRVYDAHELFTEMKEVISRGSIKKMWTSIEKFTVPQFKKGYTVSEGIAKEFEQRYGVKYDTIRNMPALQPLDPAIKKENFILYQGAVNEGRGLEYLVEAMHDVTIPLVICGDGNYMTQLKSLVQHQGLSNKIILKGMLPPSQLWIIAQQAMIGMGQAEKEGLNQYLALPNKFFDYLHAGLPQVSMNYPEYKKINDKYKVAILIDGLSTKTIAGAINNLLTNSVLYNQLHQNCLSAREELNWDKEEDLLLSFYQKIFKNIE
ncbi:MAG TPA: glycosyltransferase [Chitinophagaceae bacterium]